MIGGVKTRSSNIVGTGTLGTGGNYAGNITTCASSILYYLSTTAQNLSGVISGPGAVTTDAGSGTLTLSGANTYSGNTTVNGTSVLHLASTGSLNFVIGNSSNNKITGGGTAILDGSFTIDTSAVTAFTGSWTLADVTTKTYGTSFGVTGFTPPTDGTVHTFTDAQFRTWTFDTSTSVLSVAAPALITSFSVSLAGGSAAVIDQVAKTIQMYVPTGTAVNSLAPTYTLTSGTCDHDNGITAYDFTSPVTYKVTDGATENNYVVTVSTTPLPLLGLRVWLKADAVNSADPTQVDGSGNVLKWLDQSGNGNHATKGSTQIAPTYVASTLNGQPVLRFAQTDDSNGSRLYLGDLSAQFSAAASGSSVFATATIGTPTTPTDGRYNMFGNRANDDRWVANTWTESSPGSFRGGRTSLPYASVPQTGSHVFSMESSSSTYRAVIDGAQIGTAGADYNSGSGVSWNIGNSAAGNGQQLNGDIAELILYNRILTADEANLVGGYLSGKYALTTDYPPIGATAPWRVVATAGDKEVFLSWHSFPAATGYKVKRSEVTGGPYTEVGTPSGTTFTDGPLTNGRTYYYVVSAMIDAVETPDSAEVSATPTGVNATLSTVSNTPSSVWADGVSYSTVTVTLLNDFSVPVAGKTVTLAQTSGPGSATITTVTGTTGTDGKAAFTVASTTAGTDVFTATDATDSDLVIAQTATVDFVAATSLAIHVNIDTAVRTGLVGPVGGLGAVWNTTAATSATNLLHASGPATTVGFVSSGPSWGGPDAWGSPALQVLFAGLRSFDTSTANSQQLVINNLTIGKKYDLYIASANCSGAGSNQRSYGVWKTTNTTSTPGDHICDNRANQIGDAWVPGNNYVVFGSVEPDGIGSITVDGYSIPDAPTYDVRLPMNGFQLVESVPGYASWAIAHAGGQAANLDYNNDGVPNGVAYFMGETGVASNPGVVDGKVSWPHSADATDATYRVLSSENLVDWSDVTVDSSDAGGFVTYTLPSGTPKSFVRLEVTIP
ncbi:MAG: Ig-like domain-containing protein [Verrucomicrobia bacterium]|nr:Ig-like domain-containing protein [Verrucomicrobiota bacterium]